MKEWLTIGRFINVIKYISRLRKIMLSFQKKQKKTFAVIDIQS